MCMFVNVFISYNLKAMFRLLLATHNPHKAREIADILADLPVRLTTYDEFPGIPEPEEDGRSLEENASKKARHAAGLSGLWALAEDTGLEAEALGGAPGVYSARYAGSDRDYADNNRKLLENMKGLPPEGRKAVFRTVVALSSPDGRATLEEGRLAGSILEQPRGANGFGYDPVFLVQDLGKTLAELSSQEKNELSHRSQALAKMRIHIQRLTIVLPKASVLAPLPPPVHACPRCGLELQESRCRELCPGCGYEVDCGDPA